MSHKLHVNISPNHVSLQRLTDSFKFVSTGSLRRHVLHESQKKIPSQCLYFSSEFKCWSWKLMYILIIILFYCIILIFNIQEYKPSYLLLLFLYSLLLFFQLLSSRYSLFLGHIPIAFFPIGIDSSCGYPFNNPVLESWKI